MVWVVWLSLRRAKEQAQSIRLEEFLIGQSLSNRISKLRRSLLQIQLNTFPVDFPGEFWTLNFHGHLFSTEHSLSTQQVNICGLDCKFNLVMSWNIRVSILNNHNNNHDNVYGAVIVLRALREFTRFIWWMHLEAPRGRRPLDQADRPDP